MSFGKFLETSQGKGLESMGCAALGRQERGLAWQTGRPQEGMSALPGACRQAMGQAGLGLGLQTGLGRWDGRAWMRLSFSQGLKVAGQGHWPAEAALSAVTWAPEGAGLCWL